MMCGNIPECHGGGFGFLNVLPVRQEDRDDLDLVNNPLTAAEIVDITQQLNGSEVFDVGFAARLWQAYFEESDHWRRDAGMGVVGLKAA